MHKQIGAILLVAGTCIGSGMIALPMVLAQLGIVPSTLLMLAIWLVMYCTSLVNLELNLQAGRGLSLGGLGRHFSGKYAEAIGLVSIKLLSYALLAVFLYGSASVAAKLLHAETSHITLLIALLSTLMLLLPLKLLDYLNRLLFVGLLAVITILVAGLASMINWSDLPLFAPNYKDFAVWRAVVFTSFGFQVIFHTLTNYCNKDVLTLKRAFFYGSLIPAIVYIIWTSSVLSVVHHESPQFYQHMLTGKIEVGDLVSELSVIAKWQAVQILVWWISLLAIITSILGVGVGLCDSLNTMFAGKLKHARLRNIAAAVVTILPAYLVAILVPNAFIAVLGFAGMILAVIAVLLPIYLLKQAKPHKLFYPSLSRQWLLYICVACGVLIIGCEAINMLA